MRERVALSVAMWPRGEVGVGVLLISMNYALPEIVIQLAGLSLTLNLFLTGFFIYFVIWISKMERTSLEVWNLAPLAAIASKDIFSSLGCKLIARHASEITTTQNPKSIASKTE